MTVLIWLIALGIGARTWQYAYEAWEDGNPGGGIGVALLGLSVPSLAAYLLWFT